MISQQDNTALYLEHLSGTGVEVSAASKAVRAVPSETEGGPSIVSLELQAVADSRVVQTGALGPFGNVSNIVREPAWDFVIASGELQRMPDPIHALIDWAGLLKPFGHIVITLPLYERSPDRMRPVTPLKHLVDDFKRHTRKACDEHVLAHAWIHEPSVFSNPDEIIVVLEDMWRRGIYDLDDRAKSLIRSPGNRSAIEQLRGQATDIAINHHVFNLPLLLSTMSWINANSDRRLIPIDLGLSKGYLSDMTVVLQSYPAEFAASAAGQALIQSQSKTFLRVMQTEAWISHEIDALRSVVG